MAILKRRFRVTAGANPILWQVFKDPQSRMTFALDGSVIAAPASNIINGDAIAVAAQTLGADGLITYDCSSIELPTMFGLTRWPMPDPSAPFDSDNSPFFWALNSFNGRDSYPTSAWFNVPTSSYVTHSGNTYDIDLNDSLTIRRSEGHFEFYINYGGDRSSAPVFVSKNTARGAYKPFVYFSANDTVTTKEALRCMVDNKRPSVVYSAAQAAHDFGSVPSIYYVRVRQESAIVGAGSPKDVILDFTGGGPDPIITETRFNF